VSYRLLYLPRVLKDLRKLDPAIRGAVKKALERIASNPSVGKSLLYSLKGCYSFRTSSYRIIYRVRKKELVVLVVAVGHRREVYEGLRKLLGK
jgi:mRNA interferase RelE/StbE